MHEAPFFIKRLGWGEFLLTVTVELIGPDGRTATVELEHDLKLDKEVATTIYRVVQTRVPFQSPVLAAVMKLRLPLTCSKVEQSNVFVTEGKAAPVTLLDVFARDLGKAKDTLRPMPLPVDRAPTGRVLSSASKPRPMPPPPPIRKSSKQEGDYPSWNRSKCDTAAAGADLKTILSSRHGTATDAPSTHVKVAAASASPPARPTRRPPSPPTKAQPESTANSDLHTSDDASAVGSLLGFSSKDMTGVRRPDSNVVGSREESESDGCISPQHKTSTVAALQALLPTDAVSPPQAVGQADHPCPNPEQPSSTGVKSASIENVLDSHTVQHDTAMQRVAGSTDEDLSQQDDAVVRVPVRYLTEKLSVLGRGGFGVVLKVKTTSEGGLPALVALKQLHQTAEDNADPFWLEAKIVASLPKHENVVQMFGSCVAFGKPSLVFEYCEEGDLNAYLCRAEDVCTGIQSLPPITILDLSSQIAVGMAHIHANRLYHRDLKPNNVLLTRQGNVGRSGLRAVVTDLGLAKNLSAEINLSQSMQGSCAGTYVYMAPEVISKSVFSQGGGFR